MEMWVLTGLEMEMKEVLTAFKDKNMLCFVQIVQSYFTDGHLFSLHNHKNI